MPGTGAAQGATTAATATSGQYSVQINMNNVGTTLPTTRVGFPMPPAMSAPMMLVEAMIQRNNNVQVYLCHIYTIGTVNLSALNDQFTHDAATFPILRTEFGEASKPVSLIPIIYIDDAGTTSAPVFSLKTNAGGTGYVDQDGNNEVATKTTTLPSATAAVQSAYLLRLNDGDSGVRDIVQIDVDTAGTSVGGVIFGAEVIADVTNYVSAGLVSVVNGLGWGDLKPGVATSGTATSFIGLVSMGSVSGTQSVPTIIGVLNS